jgi:hypothetical protein
MVFWFGCRECHGCHFRRWVLSYSDAVRGQKFGREATAESAIESIESPWDGNNTEGGQQYGALSVLSRARSSISLA